MAKIRKAALAYAEMVHSGKLGSLTPTELNSIFFILNDLNSGSASETISQAVADWFYSKAERGWMADIKIRKAGALCPGLFLFMQRSDFLGALRLPFSDLLLRWR